jgi:two-component system phosphate regulon sensor histidine kinase PhoR
MGYTRMFVALAVGVLLPVILSTSVGIVTLAVGESSDAIVIGVLIVCFAAAAIGGAVATVVLLGRRARIAREQADFVANVTHELRTPLAAIRMYTQTLEMGRLDGDSQRTEEALGTILRETEWLETMIDRVLTWRAAAKDRAALELVDEPVSEAVESAVSRFQRMFVPSEVDLEVSLECETPVPHDRGAIESIVLNLLINAYKYTGQEKRIQVSVADVDGKVEIAVADNGIGIPGREHGKIFDPFYRVDQGLQGQASGAGLGLAVVRHLVLAHRGEILVESEEGQGSRFVVLLGAPERERKSGRSGK